MLRNVIYIFSSIMLFFMGIIFYGIILNLREITLEEAMDEKNINEISNPSIIIDRRNYILSLYSDTLLVKQYKAVFGRNNESIKHSKNDFITPIGSYKICRVDTNHIYYKKIFLNYPNIQDAAEALKEKIINQSEFIAISNSIHKNDCPFPHSILGSDIGIHGIGEYNEIFKNLPFVFNWTNGSAAVSNENLEELLSVVQIGTKVTIKN